MKRYTTIKNASNRFILKINLLEKSTLKPYYRQKILLENNLNAKINDFDDYMRVLTLNTCKALNITYNAKPHSRMKQLSSYLSQENLSLVSPIENNAPMQHTLNKSLQQRPQKVAQLIKTHDSKALTKPFISQVAMGSILGTAGSGVLVLSAVSCGASAGAIGAFLGPVGTIAAFALGTLIGGVAASVPTCINRHRFKKKYGGLYENKDMLELTASLFSLLTLISLSECNNSEQLTNKDVEKRIKKNLNSLLDNAKNQINVILNTGKPSSKIIYNRLCSSTVDSTHTSPEHDEFTKKELMLQCWLGALEQTFWGYLSPELLNILSALKEDSLQDLAFIQKQESSLTEQNNRMDDSPQELQRTNTVGFFHGSDKHSRHLIEEEEPSEHLSY